MENPFGATSLHYTALILIAALAVSHLLYAVFSRVREYHVSIGYWLRPNCYTSPASRTDPRHFPRRTLFTVKPTAANCLPNCPNDGL